ncbi:MAG: hypothetical protein ABI411_13595 [Tahibacter sp.]
MRHVMSVLALAATVLMPVQIFATEPLDAGRIEAVRAISATETSVHLRLPPGQIVQGSVFLQPPGPPPIPTEEDDEQLDSPIIDTGEQIPPSDVAPTRTDDNPGWLAPETFTLLRDSTLAPPAGNASSVAEPSVGGEGNGLFTTHNWYAEISTNNGAGYTYVSPFTLFPSTPAAFAGGFCCDQRVLQESSRNLIFWYLQYIKTGTTATDTNGVRIAVAHGQAGLATNTWQTHDFTPANFALTGKWFDFPHMQASANYLYFTTNIFTTADAFYGALIVRIPLAQLDSNSALTVDSYITTAFGSIGALQGSAAEGTRTGRTTMYFASADTSTSLKILTWPEANSAPTVATVNGLATTTFGTFTCTDPGALNSCGRANSRVQSGWISDTELGVMWASAQNGGTRPFPYTRVAILNPSTLAVVSQPDIYSATTGMLYAALAVNQRGHLGGVIDALGGNINSTIRAIVRDDLSPNVVTSGWETFPVANSNSGTSSRWGDYNGVTAHERFPNTWVGVGHVQTGGSANANAQIHNFWFARERDTTAAITVSKSGTGAGLVTSAPAGINCGATCSASYALGTSVTLTAAPSGAAIFTGWSGACTGTGTCVLSADAPRAVTATFTLPTFLLSVSRSGTGSGTVTSAPAGINCGATCSASFDSGTVVALTPAPAQYSTFSGWGGACSGTGACNVTMSAAKSVSANFQLDSYSLSAGITDGRGFTRIGASLVYTALVTNQGPSAASNLQITAALPSSLGSASWTCSAVAGFCPATGSGSGSLSLSTSLTSGCSLQCTISATVLSIPTEQVVFGISAVPPVGPTAAPATAQDLTQIVLFRDRFEAGGDGAQ